ncbi:MAG: hypothetical protein LUE25_04605 [Clostridiales bacterium]|nr:hypothetical protein [Clostridiales bacterium]
MTETNKTGTRFISVVLVIAMLLTAFAEMIPATSTVSAAETTKARYIRISGSTGTWGYQAVTLMNGWTHDTTQRTWVYYFIDDDGDYQIAYCIQPGINADGSSVYTCYDADGFASLVNFAAGNSMLSEDEMIELLSFLFSAENSYTGAVNTDWADNPENYETAISRSLATQLLVWEIVVGERDTDFNHVNTGSYDAVFDMISTNHPFYSTIKDQYDTIVEQVQTKVVQNALASIFSSTVADATAYEMTWDSVNQVYTYTLTTDSSGTAIEREYVENLSRYTLSVDNVNVTIEEYAKTSGSQVYSVTITSTAAISENNPAILTAKKSQLNHKEVLFWTDGIYGTSNSGGDLQDFVVFSKTSVQEPAYGYLKLYTEDPEEYGTIKVYKTDENGDYLSGAVFTAMNTSTGDTYTIGPTNSSGYAENRTIPYGTYTVTETTMPSGYTVKDDDDPWTVTVSSSTPTVTINASNAVTKSLVILKRDEDGGQITTAKFTLTSTSYSGYSKTVTTSGTLASAQFTGIPSGTYKLTESYVPDGYEASSEDPWTVTVSGSGITIKSSSGTTLASTTSTTLTYTVTNTSAYGSIEVYKTAAEDGSNLSGAYFTATDTSTGDTYSIGPTNSSGYAINSEIPYGTYTVTETTMPSGYTEKDADDPWTVTVSSSNSAVTINAEDTGYGTITINKVDNSGSALSGATFTATNKSTGTKYTGTTNSSGVAAIKVPYGSYTVTESTVPTGYTKDEDDPWTVTVSKSSTTVTINASNAVAKTLVILKRDEYGGMIRQTTE